MTDRDKLIELLQNFADGTYSNNGRFVDNTQVDKVADHLLANGVIVPPCKVGKLVFFVADGQIYNGNILSFSMQLDGLWFYAKYASGLTYWHEEKDFDRRVFLTKEAAEAKLKEREGNG